MDTQCNNVVAMLVSVAACLGVFVTIYSQYRYSQIRRSFNMVGKGPFSWPLLGNLYHFLFVSNDKYTEEFRKKFGRLFVMFVGPVPRIMIGDAEIIRRISTRDFDIAVNHDFIGNRNIYSSNFLVSLNDSHWKKVRAMMSPTFTSSKIKIMYKLIGKCCDDIVNCINEQFETHSNKPFLFATKKTYQMFSLDAIASCCYALKLNRHKGETSIDAMAKRSTLVKSMLSVFVPDKLHTILTLILPNFLRKFLYLNSNTKAAFKLAEIIQPVIKERQKKTKVYNDYLQILVDANIDDEMVLNETDAHEDHHAGMTKELLLKDQQKIVKDYLIEAETSDKNLLSENEMIANAIFLLIVGLETTASSLTIITYSLAMHQECQQRLYEEVKKIANKEHDGSYGFDYEELTACAYLDSVICESIRINSPVSMIDRKITDDYRIDEYNVTVPKNTTVFFLMQLVHRDAEYWPEPLKFNPDRFMPENRGSIVPGSYTPFGQGPRHCLGMRFSLTETKLALAKIIMQFKFLPKENSVWPLKAKPGLGITNFLNTEVFVERRSQD